MTLSDTAKGDKMPGFVRSLRNSWTITPAGGGAELCMALEADIAFPHRLIMAPLMRMQFARLLRETLEDFKHFAETGQPHPRNVRSAATAPALAARAAAA